MRWRARRTDRAARGAGAGARCVGLPELPDRLHRGRGSPHRAADRPPAGAAARPGAQPPAGAALGIHGARGRCSQAVGRRGDGRHEPGRPVGRLDVAVQHRQACDRAAVDRGANPGAGPGHPGGARLRGVHGRAAAHRPVGVRRPLPGAPAVRLGAEVARGYRQPLVTQAVVDRAAARLCAAHEGLPPIREAIRMIEEDPDTMLDVLHLLDHESLPRAHARQMITRTGTDRLQLSGAVVLADGRYTLLNQAYRQALAGTSRRSASPHVLRIAGRWNEAIEYLAPRLAFAQKGEGEKEQGGGGAEEQRSGGAEGRGDATRNTQYAIRNPQYGAARPQLLEAIVQSIYATDSLEKSCELLVNGLRLGFGLEDVSVYRAVPAQGRLEQVYPPAAEGRPSAGVDLHDPACVEAQTFIHSNYALRGTADEARLVVTLATANRPIGIVTVERYVRHRDPHELPEELPDLLRFLQHAAGAIENVMIRAAYRTIGQAVLHARAMKPTVERVLDAVSDALGCDYAVLYLVDDHRKTAEMTAGVGLAWSAEWQAEARFPLDGRHPAASCLADGRLLAVRGTDERLDAATAERFGLHKYTRIFLPLQAAGEQSGTLELGLRRGRPRPALRGEQAHLRRVRRSGRHRGIQHAVAAPHRRGADAQDGGAGGGPRNPAQPAAEGLPGRARLGVRGVLQRGADRRRRLL